MTSTTDHHICTFAYVLNLVAAYIYDLRAWISRRRYTYVLKFARKSDETFTSTKDEESGEAGTTLMKIIDTVGAIFGI